MADCRRVDEVVVGVMDRYDKIALKQIVQKLTKAQARELTALAETEDGKAYYANQFRPAWRLYELDLIARLNPVWVADWFVITALGREVAAVIRDGETP
jgi:hypothetical protein